MSGRPGLVCPAPNPDELQGFPYEWLGRKRELWRATRRDLGPWWFSSDGSSRFDLPPPKGTCYLAGDRYGAIRETLGAGVKTVPPSFLEERHLAQLRVQHSVKIANTTTDRAVPFGVTRELASMVPYDCPQSWAEAFHELGYGGLQYQLRFSLSESIGFAVYGPGGEQAWPVEEYVPISETDINSLFADQNTEVARIPRSTEINILAPD